MHRAFVVQFKADYVPGEVLRGRVEHVRSGRASHFESVGELVDFFTRSMQSEQTDAFLPRESQTEL